MMPFVSGKLRKEMNSSICGMFIAKDRIQC